MKPIIIPIVLAVLAATSARAENQSTPFLVSTFNAETDLTVSDLLGARVFATEADISMTIMATEPESNGWQDVGEISDIVLSQNGKVQTVIVGIGGLLGAAKTDIFVEMGDLIFFNGTGNDAPFVVVIDAKKLDIEDAISYQSYVADKHAGSTSQAENTTDPSQ